MMAKSLPENQPSTHGEGQDRIIEPRFWSARRILWAVVTSMVLALVTLGVQALLIDDNAREVDLSELTISEVRRDSIQEAIAGAGELVPRTTVFLDTITGGQVDEIYVQDGARVEKGQPLLRLSNSDLQLRLIDIDAQRLNQVDRLNESRFRSRQIELEQRQAIEELSFQIQQMERRTARNKRLFDAQLLSVEDKEAADEELVYLQLKREFTVRTQLQSRELQQKQLQDMARQINTLESSFEILRDMLDDLTVRSPISGQLTSLEAEVGEMLPAGSRLGKIDKSSDGYIIQAKIDEFYVDRIEPGHRGHTLPMGGRKIDITVARVHPQVAEGQFLVDLRMEGTVPDGLRRGQTVGFRLDLGAPDMTAVLPRGHFYQSTGGNWIFVLVEDDRAERHPIRLGRRSSDLIEVLDGLRVGDKVITSSYRDFGNAEILIFK